MEILPLKDFNELKDWSPANATKAKPLTPRSNPVQWNLESNLISLERLRSSMKSSPKTLVCHDLKGGYLEDRFVAGSTCQEQPYSLFHWSGIDIFVYFSHNFVTIPPLGWIEAAHLHGVRVLGTIITEWDQGEKLCESMLQSDEAQDLFVENCVDIMDAYNFDGWLVNIENKLSKEQTCRMVQMVERLTQLCHEKNGKSQVIWYDSVTVNGELKWQNELNDLNKAFFDACDGIFLNYTWKVNDEVDNLQNSLDCAQQSGRHHHDIYVGIDVYGRGCFGGGGFDTDLAVKVARDKDMSIALFAPSWTYEKDINKDFPIGDYFFWNKLGSMLHFRGPKMEVISSKKIVFSSSFHCGVEKTEGCWQYNLAKTEYQPTFLAQQALPYVSETDDAINLFHVEEGIRVSAGGERTKSWVPLLICNIKIEEPATLLFQAVISQYEGQEVNLGLLESFNDGTVLEKSLALNRVQHQSQEFALSSQFQPCDIEAIALKCDIGQFVLKSLTICQS